MGQGLRSKRQYIVNRQREIHLHQGFPKWEMSAKVDKVLLRIKHYSEVGLGAKFTYDFKSGDRSGEAVNRLFFFVYAINFSNLDSDLWWKFSETSGNHHLELRRSRPELYLGVITWSWEDRVLSYIWGSSFGAKIVSWVICGDLHLELRRSSHELHLWIFTWS